MNIVDVQELTKVYSSKIGKHSIVALDGITLGVQQGEVFGLLGPNGAGKTTFLKLLLGITSPTSGSISINGLPPADPKSRQKVGYLPENHRFPDHLTGQGLLELTARLYGLPSSEFGARTKHLVDLVGMGKWAEIKMKKYSKGMLQRIGLAQALICDPEILLLDEPTDGVDPVGRVEVREVLRKARNEGKTIIINSHLLSEMEAIADRVVILSKGRIIRVSTVDELTSRQSHFEVEADMGSQLFEIPPEVGKLITISSKGLIVELTKEENINVVIDQLRMKRINIRSVKPMKISLEQSFIETLGVVQEPN